MSVFNFDRRIIDASEYPWGVGVEIPTLIGSFIDSNSASDTSHTLTVPTHSAGDTLVAVLMWRLPHADITAPTGWTLHTGNLLSIMVVDHRLHVYTKIATDSEPANYTWSASTAVRNCGLMVSVRNFKRIFNIVESYGNGVTATIATAKNRLNLTVFTWLYADTSAETYSQNSDDGLLTQISDSPTANARISGGHVNSQTIVTSTHNAASTDNNPNHSGICIQM